MEKEILIDASQEKQTRVAIKSDNGVEDMSMKMSKRNSLREIYS